METDKIESASELNVEPHYEDVVTDGNDHPLALAEPQLENVVSEAVVTDVGEPTVTVAEPQLEAVVLEDVVTDVSDHPLTVAELFLAKEVRIANELGLNPKRKLHLATVRSEVAKSLKGDK